MKDRQPCQSVAEARLSVGSAIAAPAITISLKSSLSTARQHRREEPLAANHSDDFSLSGGFGIASVRGSCWLNQQQVRFFSGEWTMFDTLRDNKHLSRFQSDGPVPELDVDFT